MVTIIVVSMCENDTTTDLMLLEMSDFDVILGMDWLSSCHAMVDCREKAIKFNVSGDKSFICQGDRSEIPNNITSMLSARLLLRKGCQGYLDFVRDVEKYVKNVGSVPVVGEFPDVFLE